MGQNRPRFQRFNTINFYKKECDFFISTIKETVLKRYYDMVFPDELREHELIRIVCIKPPIDTDNDPITVVKYARNFEEYQTIINKYRYNYNVYNQLATIKEVDGELGGTASHQRQRRVLYLDFDLKDYRDVKNPDAHYFMQRIKDKFPNLFVHAYYNSGGGYHYYIEVKPTCNINDLVAVNVELARAVGADLNAVKPTQIARVPTSLNQKYTDDKGKHPCVIEICNSYNPNPQNGHKSYVDMNYIKSMINAVIKEEETREQPLQTYDYTANDGLMEPKQFPCLCNKVMLEQGVEQGERNVCMGRLIYWMIKQGKQDSYIHSQIQKWNERCRPPKSHDEVEREVNEWLKHKEQYHIGGCWWNITDERTKNIVEKYCDRVHCLDNMQSANIAIAPDIGVKMNKKILSKNHLRTDGKNAMSGYEYLILTIIDKHNPPNRHKPFVVAELKKRLLHREHGKWSMCMDERTLKDTMDSLINHKCITLSIPTKKQCGKNNPTYDDYIIRLTRRLRDISNSGFIEFYYSSALAFICKQISQREYKVFLALIQQMELHRSCSLNELSYILNMDKSDVSKALHDLDTAQCIEIVPNTDYNLYRKRNTNIYDEDTVNDNVEQIILDKPESLEIRLLA